MSLYYIVQTIEEIACLKTLLQREGGKRSLQYFFSTLNVCGFIMNPSPLCN